MSGSLQLDGGSVRGSSWLGRGKERRQEGISTSMESGKFRAKAILSKHKRQLRYKARNVIWTTIYSSGISLDVGHLDIDIFRSSFDVSAHHKPSHSAPP